MKSNKLIVLVLISSALSGCANTQRSRREPEQGQGIPARGQQGPSRSKAPAKQRPTKQSQNQNQAVSPNEMAAGNQPAPRKENWNSQKSTKTQPAVVAVDGAAVFEQPNFDSPIKAYFEKGKKVRVSESSTPGLGGFGLFYKLIGRGQVIGYMTDVDITPQFKTDEFGDVDPSQKKNQNVELIENPAFKGEDPVADANAPMVFQRFIGGGLYNVNYTENIGGKKLSSNTWMYTFKLSGPNTLFDGPPLDVNVKFSPSVPTYYTRFAEQSRGMFFIVDMLLTLPLMEFEKGMVFYGFGPQFVYTRFSVAPIVDGINTAIDSHELKMGLGLMAGFKYRVYKRWFVHGDFKYYKERESYPAFGFAIQKVY